MNVDSLLAGITPEIYRKLVTAVETGKWPDGKALTAEQKESTMQTVLLYQAKIENSQEHMTVNASGEIVQKSKSEFKQSVREQKYEKQTISRFNHDDI